MEVDLKIILSIVGSFFGAYFWLYNNTKTNLQQKLYRDKKVKLLESHTFEEKYKTNLQSLINWIDNIYNNSSLIQNYSRHVTIAMIYSFMVFLLFWVLGADGKISSIKIINNLEIYNKLQVGILITCYFGILLFFYNKVKLSIYSIILFSITIVLERTLLDTGYYLGINFSGISLFMIMLLFWKKMASYHLFKPPLFGIFLMVFGVLLLIPYGIHTNNQEVYTLGLFLILLPLANSILDYISLKVSKYMAEQIMQDNTILTILLHLLTDLIIAIILLLSLALFLHFSVELLNIFIVKPIPMKEMLIATWNDPFSLKNGWITFMLFSTLVPTFVHLVLALGALFIAIMPSAQSLKELKMYNKGQEALLESSAHYFTRIAFMQTLFAFVILILLSLPFWYEKLL